MKTGLLSGNLALTGVITTLPVPTFAGSFLGVFLLPLASSSSELDEKLA